MAGIENPRCPWLVMLVVSKARIPYDKRLDAEVQRLLRLFPVRTERVKYKLEVRLACRILAP